MATWALFAAMTFSAAMLPGPNLAIVLRNTLSGSRRDGMLTALGLACALLTHGTLALLGIATLLHNHPLLFEAVRWFGAAYLVLLGIRQLRARQEDPAQARARRQLSPWLSGLLTCLLNPKVLMFFIAVFAQLLNQQQSLALQALYVATPAMTELSWFALLLLLFSRPGVQSRLRSGRQWLQRLTGGALILLGIRLGMG